MKIVLIFFVVIETLNVLTLLFNPESQIGNGIGIFDVFKASKEDEKVYALMRYLIDWIACTKLIFIGLIIAIVLKGSYVTQQLALVMMIVSILAFFWRLYPRIKVMDQKGWINPRGYSKTLFSMIAVFVVIFFITLILSFLL